jgi:hypothetical protein
VPSVTREILTQGGKGTPGQLPSRLVGEMRQVKRPDKAFAGPTLQNAILTQRRLSHARVDIATSARYLNRGKLNACIWEGCDED